MATSVNGQDVWWPNVSRLNRIVENNWPVNGTTYIGHGVNGAPSAVDYVVSNGWGVWVNRRQSVRGWRIANWVVANWRALGVDYVIFEGWWNRIDGTGWHKYPWWTWSGGSPNKVSRKHGDHVHVSCHRKSNIRGVRHPR